MDILEISYCASCHSTSFSYTTSNVSIWWCMEICQKTLKSVRNVRIGKVNWFFVNRQCSRKIHMLKYGGDDNAYFIVGQFFINTVFSLCYFSFERLCQIWNWCFSEKSIRMISLWFIQNRPVKIIFGFGPTQDYGIMMYHRNRLIKAYEKVGCQKQVWNRVNLGRFRQNAKWRFSLCYDVHPLSFAVVGRPSQNE